MDPYSGRTYALGADLAPQDIGAELEMSEFRARVAELGDRATEEERRAAIEARALVRVSDEAAQVARLGERELERRKRRRRAARGARKGNR